VSFILPENKFKPRVPLCSNTDVARVAGSGAEPESASDAFQERIYLCRESAEVLGLFACFLIFHMQQYLQHFHLHLTYGKIIARFIIFMRTHPMHPQC